MNASYITIQLHHSTLTVVATNALISTCFKHIRITMKTIDSSSKTSSARIKQWFELRLIIFSIRPEIRNNCNWIYVLFSPAPSKLFFSNCNRIENFRFSREREWENELKVKVKEVTRKFGEENPNFTWQKNWKNQSCAVFSRHHLK